MMDDGCMSTDRNGFVAKPGNTLAHIFNIFTCDRHYNIAGFSDFRFCKYIIGNPGQRLGCTYAKMGVHLPIMDTRTSCCSKVFLLEIAAATDGRYLAKCDWRISKHILNELNQPCLSVCLSKLWCRTQRMSRAYPCNIRTVFGGPRFQRVDRYSGRNRWHRSCREH